jgi:8-oxo-dGTP pyrophosphatase MutT (NUDIX family)
MDYNVRELCIFAEIMDKIEGFIGKLGLSLKTELPGPASHHKMAPGIRLENKHGSYLDAAVLILLFRKTEKWHFVLMRRPEYEGAHSKQVSLPGGIHEEGDKDMEATALRETREELGIDDSGIQILGSLSRLSIPISGIDVSPFVGYYQGTPEFHPDPSEVEYLIEVPLSDLMTPDNVRMEHRTILCRVVKVPYFNIGGEKVWGATAMILSEFLDLVRNQEGTGPE